MNPRFEIRGTLRRAKLSLLGARQALLNGVEDDDCMLTVSDMEGIQRELKDMTQLLKDVKAISSKFGTVAAARKAISV